MSNGTAFRGFRDLLERRHLEVQCNIFAFGVILLEIISGRPPYCKDRGCLVDWVWILFFFLYLFIYFCYLSHSKQSRSKHLFTLQSMNPDLVCTGNILGLYVVPSMGLLDGFLGPWPGLSTK